MNVDDDQKTAQEAARRRARYTIGLYFVIALYLMFVMVGAGYIFVTLWPSQPITSGAAFTGNVTVNLRFVSWTISEETRVLGLVLTAGVIGAVTYGLYAEFVHIVRRDFNRRWTLWYFARPFVGGFFALIFYLFLRGGLLSIGTSASQLNVFVFSAISALVGMFSEETLAKFKSIAESMLTKAEFIEEKYVTGEAVQNPGTYVFNRHSPGGTCSINHHGQTKTLEQGESFPKAPDCPDSAIWTLVRAK